jgi:hypothetical protein
LNLKKSSKPANVMNLQLSSEGDEDGGEEQEEEDEDDEM